MLLQMKSHNMKAVKFCAIALAAAAVTYVAISRYSPALSVQAANGLECTLEGENKTTNHPSKSLGLTLPYDSSNPHDRPGAAPTESRLRHIEFLPDNRFRVVDEEARNDVLANDYFGTMTTTDTAYTFGVPGDREKGEIGREFSGLVVDRQTTKLYEHYVEVFAASDTETTITGWCTSTYVAPGPYRRNSDPSLTMSN
jgi:hypothetical protein